MTLVKVEDHWRVSNTHSTREFERRGKTSVQVLYSFCLSTILRVFITCFSRPQIDSGKRQSINRYIYI
uniref:Uncharacterized protein n=1 Tax=Heterorhabditis bacteriophora TaxID=37862 RepID=A0A1I7WKF0_HETBA